MDKKIIDTLVKFGLITNVGIDANSCNSIDELINKGIVTIPGAKDKIEEIIKDLDTANEELFENNDIKKIVVENKEIVADEADDKEIVADDKEIVVENKEDETTNETAVESVKNNIVKSNKSKNTK